MKYRVGKSGIHQVIGEEEIIGKPPHKQQDVFKEDPSWTINCIIFGAEMMNKVREGKDQEVIEKVKKLSPGISDSTAGYILMRLKNVHVI